MKKKVTSWLFLALVFILTLWSIFRGENLNEVFTFLSSADITYVIPAVSCVILFIFGESVIIYYMLFTLGIRVKFTHCCLYSFIGFFYSAITPSASGGQPMQIIAMRKDKIPVAVSTVVLAIVTITYKLVLVLFGTTVLIVRPVEIMPYLSPVISIVYLGLGLNIICVAFLFFLVFRPQVVRISAQKILSLWNRIRPTKDINSRKSRLDKIFEQYEGTADYFRTHNITVLKVFLLTVLQRFILFLITWLTYKSFTLSGHNIRQIVSLQAMISVATDMLPLPGGMVFSENLFLAIFEPIFGANLVLPGMIISRGISYYTQVLISAIMTVVASFVITGKNLKGNV